MPDCLVRAETTERRAKQFTSLFDLLNTPSNDKWNGGAFVFHENLEIRTEKSWKGLVEQDISWNQNITYDLDQHQKQGQPTQAHYPRGASFHPVYASGSQRTQTLGDWDLGFANGADR